MRKKLSVNALTDNSTGASSPLKPRAHRILHAQKHYVEQHRRKAGRGDDSETDIPDTTRRSRSTRTRHRFDLQGCSRTGTKRVEIVSKDVIIFVTKKKRQQQVMIATDPRCAHSHTEPAPNQRKATVRQPNQKTQTHTHSKQQTSSSTKGYLLLVCFEFSIPP